MKKILLPVLVFVITFIDYILIVWYFFSDMTSRAQFGDLFGGLNTIFSGLAFAGVIYTVILQTKDLELQREELKLTREELKRTAEAQEKSEKSLSKQAASLKMTAKINGKSAILQHYNTLIEITNSAKFGIDNVSFNKYKEHADGIIDEIDRLIQHK